MGVPFGHKNVENLPKKGSVKNEYLVQKRLLSDFRLNSRYLGFLNITVDNPKFLSNSKDKHGAKKGLQKRSSTVLY